MSRLKLTVLISAGVGLFWGFLCWMLFKKPQESVLAFMITGLIMFIVQGILAKNNAPRGTPSNKKTRKKSPEEQHPS